MKAIYQCYYCGEYHHTYVEVCRFCSSEAIVLVTDEGAEEYGEKRRFVE
jgi:hypothetical protein